MLSPRQATRSDAAGAASTARASGVAAWLGPAAAAIAIKIAQGPRPAGMRSRGIARHLWGGGGETLVSHVANSRLPCTNVEHKLQAPFPGVLSIDRKHLDTRLIDEQVARATGEIYAGEIVLTLAPRRCPAVSRYRRTRIPRSVEPSDRREKKTPSKRRRRNEQEGPRRNRPAPARREYTMYS